jgi:hypothetical protein
MDGWRAAGEDARKGEEIGDERRQEERKKERFQEERSAARWSDDERQRTTRRGVGCGRRESVMRGGGVFVRACSAACASSHLKELRLQLLPPLPEPLPPPWLWVRIRAS